MDAIESQLSYEPKVEMRNWKLLRETSLLRWELRIGKYRVFYNVDELNNTVDIVAVGYKRHNTLYIRGKEVKV